MRRPALIAQLREYQRKNEEEAITGGYEDGSCKRACRSTNTCAHNITTTSGTTGEYFDSLDPRASGSI